MAAVRHITRDPAAQLITAPAYYTEYAAPAGSIRTQIEGRNQDPILQVREERVIRNKPRYDHETFQRVPQLMHVPAAELANNRMNPDVRIPMAWWNTFLPPQVRHRFANGARIDHSPGNKTGPHLPQLEREHITAPTYTRVQDQHGHARQITANARPQLLYPKINTADRPANEKHCSYGKIRDPSTNSWRCIRNPNHHADDA